MSRTSKMDNLDSNGPTPALRFPEFDDGGAWQRETLCRLASPVKEKATGGDNEDTLTLSGEMGLVPQGDYFGKQISGENVSRYIKIVRDDFVYNDRTTKASKFGSIKRLTSTDGGIVSPIYKCFRFRGGQKPDFWDYYFEAQAHEAQLGGLVNEGARAGRFNISIDKFLSIDVWKPSSREQERIAECLASIDVLIEAHIEKLDALKDHKQGLMQQLFPAEGEDLPKRRFPEFANEGAWEEKRIDQLCKPFSGGTPPTSRDEYYGGEIPFIRSAEIALERTELFLTPEGLTNSAAKLVSPGDVLIALYGANSGEVAVSKIEGAINQAILCLQVGPDSEFVAQYWSHLKQWIVNTYIQGGQGNISGEIVKSIKLRMPRNPSERLKVSKVLMAADNLMESQENRIERLRLHKLGLLQQLFPVLDEVDG